MKWLGLDLPYTLMVITSLQFSTELYIQGNRNFYLFVTVNNTHTLLFMKSGKRKGEWREKENYRIIQVVDGIGAWWEMREWRWWSWRVRPDFFHSHSLTHTFYFHSPLCYPISKFWNIFPFNSSLKLRSFVLLDNYFLTAHSKVSLSLSSSLLFRIASFTTYVCIFWVNEILFWFLSLLLSLSLAIYNSYNNSSIFGHWQLHLFLILYAS